MRLAMRPSYRRSSRALFVLLGLTATFAAGFAGRALFPGEAHAQSAPATSTVYVPADGLVFRSLDGRPIARLSRDGRGGILELFDDRDQPMTRFVAEPFAARARAVECAPVSRSYVLDDGDPWSSRP